MDYIEFPNMFEFKINISRVAFSIFTMPIYWYGIIIASGIMISLILANRHCERYGITKDNVADIFVYSLIGAVIFARLYYVVFKINDFDWDFSSIINTRTGGLAIYGGIIGGVLVGIIYSKIKNIKFLKLADFFAPYIVFSQAVGRWGNFVNQEAFGYNTDLPWGMTGNRIKEQLITMKIDGLPVNPNALVHPTFIYESIWNIIVFTILLLYRRKKKFDGEVFAMYMILYGIGRAFVESLRTDSLYWGSYRVSMMLGIVFFIVFTVFILVKRYKKSLN